MPGKNNQHADESVSQLPPVLNLSWKERYEIGRSIREINPRSAHAEWSPPQDRDMLSLIRASNEGRVETLVPIRHGRMMVSPFTFYRGAPALMAYDLVHTPSSGIYVQLCGDCHISNFGMFASPERALVFDLNDFDETLPGPFEWDVKRIVASIVVAAQNAGLTKKDAKKAVQMAVRIYRMQINDYAKRSYLDTWYSRVEADVFLDMVEKKHRKIASAQLARVRDKDRLAAFSKLTEVVDHERRIIHEPPLVYRLNKKEKDISQAIIELFTAYGDSLEDSQKRLFSRYRFVDLAHKVVGVGSVGTQCFISLWIGIDEGDPLFLQVKQARSSLLEPYLGRSEYDHPGQRIVTGQRLMQATKDIFLGYGRIGTDTYFIRQLFDMKGSANLEIIPAAYLERYAALCGAVLARAHARTGDPAQIAGYLGNSDSFDEAMIAFAIRYAQQNEQDFNNFCKAVQDGLLPAKVIEK
jgi:uncharacterized protein (DUF2252 family)